MYLELQCPAHFNNKLFAKLHAGMAGVRAAVQRTPGATGLAVIITNDYADSPPEPKLSKLPGTNKDGEALSRALTGLTFAVHWRKNVDEVDLKTIVNEISRLDYSTVKDYCCILFIFAGHGREGDSLFMRNGSTIHVIEDIINPLVPENAMDIGTIPKAFLIDACRGKEKTGTVLVPRGGADIESRGGDLIDRLKVAGKGGYLLAYSTLPSHKAYESKDEGGVWLSMIAKFLEERKHLESLETLLTKANEELGEWLQHGKHTFQQPERYSRINKIICLDPNGKGCV